MGTNLGCHDQSFSITYAKVLGHTWAKAQSSQNVCFLAYLNWLWWMFKDNSEEHITNLSCIHYLLQTVGAFDTCLIEWKPASKKVLSPWGQFNMNYPFFSEFSFAFCQLDFSFLLAARAVCAESLSAGILSAPQCCRTPQVIKNDLFQSASVMLLWGVGSSRLPCHFYYFPVCLLQYGISSFTITGSPQLLGFKYF